MATLDDNEEAQVKGSEPVSTGGARVSPAAWMDRQASRGTVRDGLLGVEYQGALLGQMPPNALLGQMNSVPAQRIARSNRVPSYLRKDVTMRVGTPCCPECAQTGRRCAGTERIVPVSTVARQEIDPRLLMRCISPPSFIGGGAAGRIGANALRIAELPIPIVGNLLLDRLRDLTTTYVPPATAAAECAAIARQADEFWGEQGNPDDGVPGAGPIGAAMHYHSLLLPLIRSYYQVCTRDYTLPRGRVFEAAIVEAAEVHGSETLLGSICYHAHQSPFDPTANRLCNAAQNILGDYIWSLLEGGGAARLGPIHTRSCQLLASILVWYARYYCERIVSDLSLYFRWGDQLRLQERARRIRYPDGSTCYSHIEQHLSPWHFPPASRFVISTPEANRPFPLCEPGSVDVGTPEGRRALLNIFTLAAHSGVVEDS